MLAAGFLWLVERGQEAFFVHIPQTLGWSTAPTWWVLMLLAIGGFVVWLGYALSPGVADGPLSGFHFTIDLRLVPGTLVAALGTLIFGFVLGPEAPLIMLGVALGAILTRGRTEQVRGAAMFLGGAAAIGAVFGNPFVTAFMLLEIAAFGLIPAVWMIPGLVALASGYLVQIGIWSLPGLGVNSLAVPGLPTYDVIQPGDLIIAALIAIVAGALSVGARSIAQRVQVVVGARYVLGIMLAVIVTAIVVLVADLANIDVSLVLFSGNGAMSSLLTQASALTVVIIIGLKMVAYAIALGSGLRGGPIFPATYLGVGVGVLGALLIPSAHLTPLVVAGIAASAAAMIKLPGTAAILAALLALGSGAAVAPFAIIGAVIGLLIRMMADRRIADEADAVNTPAVP